MRHAGDDGGRVVMTDEGEDTTRQSVVNSASSCYRAKLGLFVPFILHSLCDVVKQPQFPSTLELYKQM